MIKVAYLNLFFITIAQRGQKIGLNSKKKNGYRYWYTKTDDLLFIIYRTVYSIVHTNVPHYVAKHYHSMKTMDILNTTKQRLINSILCSGTTRI